MKWSWTEFGQMIAVTLVLAGVVVGIIAAVHFLVPPP